MADLALSTLDSLDQVDPGLVEHVLDEAFGPGRHGRTAYIDPRGHRLAARAELRRARRAASSVVGTIQAWPVALTAPRPAAGIR